MKTLNEMATLAQQSRQQAYAPYSQFHVGACIKSTSGRYYSACNVENASYGLTLCAEANAISMMVAAGERSIESVYIIGDGDAYCTPCGGCRQRLAEFSSADTMVTMANGAGDHFSVTFAELLPYPFGEQVQQHKD